VSGWKAVQIKTGDPDIARALDGLSEPARETYRSRATTFRDMVEQEHKKLMSEEAPMSDEEVARLRRILEEDDLEFAEPTAEAPAAPIAPPEVETAIEGTTPKGVGGSLAEPEDEIRLTLTPDLRELLIQQQQSMQNSTMARAMRVEVSLGMVADFLLREAAAGYNETSAVPPQLGTAPQARGLVRKEDTSLPPAPTVPAPPAPPTPQPASAESLARALQVVSSVGWSQSSAVPSGQVDVHAFYTARGWVRMVAYRNQPAEDPTERRHYAQIENTAQYQISDNERIFYWYPQSEEYPDWKTLDPELHPACQRHTPEPNRISYQQRGFDLNGRKAERAMLPWGPVDGLHQDWSV
jgi:hypothetical protein